MAHRHDTPTQCGTRRDVRRRGARTLGRLDPHGRPDDRGDRNRARSGARRRPRDRCERDGARTGFRQHAPPLRSDVDARGSRGAERRTLRLARRAVSRLGADHARGVPQRDGDRVRRARALRLHDRERSYVCVAERLHDRRSDRGCGRHRHAVPRGARVDVDRTLARRLAAGRVRRGGTRDPRRHRARDPARITIRRVSR